VHLEASVGSDTRSHIVIIQMKQKADEDVQYHYFTSTQRLSDAALA